MCHVMTRERRMINMKEECYVDTRVIVLK